MKKISVLLLFLFSFNLAEAKVFKFVSCSSEQGQSTVEKVQELLSEPQRPGEAHHVGYYELKKQGEVVGYLPFYMDKNKSVISSAYFCTDYWGDYYYVNRAAQDINNWIPTVNQTIILKDIYNDEAVSNLKITRIDPSEVRIDVFVRDLGGANDVIKDIVTLSLTPKIK